MTEDREMSNETTEEVRKTIRHSGIQEIVTRVVEESSDGRRQQYYQIHQYDPSTGRVRFPRAENETFDILEDVDLALRLHAIKWEGWMR